MTNLEKRLVLVEKQLAELQKKYKKLEKKHLGSVHKGKKTKEVIAQEIKSLFNAFKPETATDQEKAEFLKEFEKSSIDVSKLSESDQKWVAEQVKEFQQQIEEIQKRDK